MKSTIYLISHEPLSSVLLQKPVHDLKEQRELASKKVIPLGLLVLLTSVGGLWWQWRGAVGGEDDPNHAGEGVHVLVDDGIGCGLLVVITSGQTTLLGTEAGYGHRLADLLAVPAQQGHGQERGACRKERMD